MSTFTMLIVLAGVSFTEPLPSAQTLGVPGLIWQQSSDMTWGSKTFWILEDCVRAMRTTHRALAQAGLTPVHESCTEARVRAGTW